MSKVKAEWTVELNVNCPECNHLFDLTEVDDFWAGAEVGEHETPRTTDFECCCPECDHEFTCDFTYGGASQMSMTTNKQTLLQRIENALKDFTNGRASMHVPPLDTDVDMVLADCANALEAAEKRIAEMNVSNRILASDAMAKQDIIAKQEKWIKDVEATMIAATDRAEAAELRNAVLTESLKDMVRANKSAIHVGYERIIDLGGECDSPAVMISGNCDIMRAEKILAAATDKGE
ncbi:hypothetical protein [Lelliottia amnigena]|uniref:hypothetical protein n=1 Tax=Lelliottia amnigena TaxID=61646 RepID=UPI003BA037DD